MILQYDDNTNDDDIRLDRLIRATLNQKWAYHPNCTWEDTCIYARRAVHNFDSVDLFQHKDTNCSIRFSNPPSIVQKSRRFNVSTKTCVKCDKPRMISNSGKELTMCEAHQREYWRSKKPKAKRAYKKHTAPKPEKMLMPDRDEPKTRKCNVCKKSKSISEFRRWGMNYRRTCKQCEGINNSPSSDNHILLINDEQVILASVVSQTDHIKNKSLVLDFYKQQGYDIQHVYEREV